MNTVLLVTILVAVLFVMFSASRMRKIKETERRSQEQKKREGSEKVMTPERKLHEEEKKRWEDEYWKRQEKRGR